MRVRLKHQALADILARRSLSLNHWAKRIGIGRGHLSQLVNGKRSFPRAETREKLLAALDVEFDELFEWHSEPKAETKKETKAAPRRTFDLPAVLQGVDRPRGRRRNPTMMGVELVTSLLQNFRYALRQLTARPAFSGTAILLLAIGIAANTSLFSVTYTMLWKPFPYEDPERVVRVHRVEEARGMTRGTFSYPNFVDYREQLGTVLSIAAADWEPYGIAKASAPDGGEPQRIGGGQVSYNLFEVLGAKPLMGRTFYEDEDRPGGDPVVILSEQLWRSYFASDPEIVGQEVLVNGAPRRVIGVMPHYAVFPTNAQLWVPLARDATADSRDGNWLMVLGRLAEGVQQVEANAVLRAVAARLEEQYPDINEGRSARTETLRAEAVSDGTDVMMLAQLGVAAFLLLIVCANVAQLMLARGATRGQEMAIRTALGASRPQLAGQLLAESLVIAFLGCGLGIGLGIIALERMMGMIPVVLPPWFAPSFNGPVVAYSVFLAFASALLCGLAPAFQTLRTNLRQALYEGVGATSAQVARLRSGLLVAEVAMSLVLLVGAGLLIQSILKTSLNDPGFEAEGALTVGLDLLAHIESEPEQRQQLVARHLERLSALSGVAHAGVVDRLPMNNSSNHRGFAIEGRGDGYDGSTNALYEVASGGYFAAMGIPLLQGEVFSDTPREGDYPVVISRSLADKYFADEEAIGQRLHFGGDSWTTIIGIVGDVRHYGIQSEPPPTAYVPFWRANPVRLTWVLRSSSDPLALVPGVRQAVAEVDPYQPLHDMRPLGVVIDESYWSWRLFSKIFQFVAAIALMLAAVGIYGVMSQAATQRRREVGIRMAFGADYQDVLKLVLWQGTRMVLIGVALGAPLALGLGKVLSSVLYAVAAFEPLPFAVVLLLIGCVGAWATALPAHRAASAPPIEAIRYE